MKSVSELKVKVFGDGADLAGILELHRLPYIKGFTTNPTLMRKAGVADYEEFAAEVLKHIKHLPISFEVFADDEQTMEDSGDQHEARADVPTDPAAQPRRHSRQCDGDDDP